MAVVTTFLEPGTDATQDFALYLSTTVSGSGTLASATDRKNTGPRSIKATQGVGIGAAGASTPDGVCLDSGTQVSFWINFDKLPGSSQQLAQVKTNAATNVLAVRINATGTINASPTGGTAVAGTAVMAVDTWYRITLSYYITNTTTYAMVIYLHDANGVLLDTVTANAGTLTRTGSSRVTFGLQTQTWGDNSNLWIDDIYIATGGASSASQPDLPSIRVTAKRPVSNGTTNGFTTQIGVGGSGYGSGHAPQVNEQPLSATNGWSMIGAGSAVTEEYNVEGLSVGDVSVRGAIVDLGGWVYASSVSNETASLILVGASTNIALTGSNTMFRAYASSTQPPPGTGTDIGIVTDTTLTTVGLYECGILIAYTQMPIGASAYALPQQPKGPPSLLTWINARPSYYQDQPLAGAQWSALPPPRLPGPTVGFATCRPLALDVVTQDPLTGRQWFALPTRPAPPAALTWVNTRPSYYVDPAAPGAQWSALPPPLPRPQTKLWVQAKPTYYVDAVVVMPPTTTYSAMPPRLARAVDVQVQANNVLWSTYVPPPSNLVRPFPNMSRTRGVAGRLRDLQLVITRYRDDGSI